MAGKKADAGGVKTAARRPPGRPSIYTREKADAILSLLASGKTPTSICKRIGMPHRETVAGWVERDIDGFADRFARARDAGYDAIAEECFAIADTPSKGVERTIKADGSIETKEVDMLGHRRLRIDTRMRILGKWAPFRYGDRQQIDHNITADTAEILMAARKRSGKQEP